MLSKEEATTPSKVSLTPSEDFSPLTPSEVLPTLGNTKAPPLCAVAAADDALAPIAPGMNHHPTGPPTPDKYLEMMDTQEGLLLPRT